MICINYGTYDVCYCDYCMAKFNKHRERLFKDNS